VSTLRGPSKATLAELPEEPCILCAGQMKAKAHELAKPEIDAFDLLYLTGFADGVRLARSSRMPAFCEFHAKLLQAMLEQRDIRLRLDSDRKRIIQ
jgi:hypothetical protein